MENEWKPVEGFEGFYEVSTNGKVRSCSRLVKSRYCNRIIKGKELKQVKDQDGYCKVQLSKEGKATSKAVHRLVAQAFIPNPNNYPVINHRDENKENNNVSNLEWCTVKYNTLYNDGVMRRAVKRRKPILVISEKGEIFHFNSITEAEEKLNLNHGNVVGCLKGYYGRKTCKGYSFEYVEE